MHFLYSIYYELTDPAFFKHYLLIFRIRCTNNNWYITCMLCLLAAARIEVEYAFPIVAAANTHNMHAINQLLFVQCLLKISK
jgi:hypothetical protein